MSTQTNYHSFVVKAAENLTELWGKKPAATKTTARAVETLHSHFDINPIVNVAYL